MTPVERAAFRTQKLRQAQHNLASLRAYHAGTSTWDRVQLAEAGREVLVALDNLWDAQEVLMSHMLNLFIIRVANGVALEIIADDQ